PLPVAGWVEGERFSDGGRVEFIVKNTVSGSGIARVHLHARRTPETTDSAGISRALNERLLAL
ncbi:hypothetical protein OH77DRAFT_1372158, partial [Trametes cingulata]